MNTSALAVALLALTGTAVVAPPAVAADLPAPTVNIADGQTLSEVETLLVSGLDPSAASVRVSYAGRVLAPVPVDPPGSPTETTEIETWGLTGNSKTLVVSQCVDAEATDCGTQATIDTSVSNPDPTHDLNPPGTAFSAPFDLTPHLAVTTGNPRLRVTLDGGTPTYVDPDNVTPVDTAALVDGPHQIAIDVCSADQLRCTPGVSVPFTVDTTGQAPATLTSQWPTLYPYDDGYRDTTRFSYTGAEPYAWVDLVIRNSAEPPAIVRTKRVVVSTDAVWGGRDDLGARVPAGSYTAVLRVVDSLGNIGFSPAATVTVSDKRLVTVTKAVTVTPKASRIGGVTGACSTRRTPSRHGWAGWTGYLSNTRCRTTFNASVVWTHNQVKLPSAVTYRDVRLGWYGGPTRAASHDRAIATLYRKDGTPQGWFSSVDYMASQYIPWVKGWRVVDDGVVSWGFQTDRGNRYDVKSFTITYRADVLR